MNEDCAFGSVQPDIFKPLVLFSYPSNIDIKKISVQCATYIQVYAWYIVEIKNINNHCQRMIIFVRSVIPYSGISLHILQLFIKLQKIKMIRNFFQCKANQKKSLENVKFCVAKQELIYFQFSGDMIFMASQRTMKTKTMTVSRYVEFCSFQDL